MVPKISLLTLDNNTEVANWISIGVSSKKSKPFDTNHEPTMSNLANCGVILKFNNSVYVQKEFSLLYSKFILNFDIAYYLNNWPRNPSKKSNK